MSAQAMEALAHANEIRLERVKLRRSVAALPTPVGRDAVAELITAPPVSCNTLAVGDSLRWVRRWDVFKAARVLGRCQVGASRRLGELTDRERQVLTDELRAL